MRWILIVLALLSFNSLATPFEQSLELIAGGKSSQRAPAVELLLSSDDPRAREVLQVWVDGALYREKSSDKLLQLKGKKGKNQLFSPLFTEEILELGKRDVRRVGLTNKLRKQIRSGLARMDLADADPNVRTAAITQLLGKLDPDTRTLLSERLNEETDDDVLDLLNTALAIDTLQQASIKPADELSDAIGTLGE